MRKITPISLSAEDSKALQSQIGTQTISTATPKSRDPINFPVFDVPVNKKVLAYVPNHVVQTEAGDTLRMDKPFIHSVTMGKRFLYYRCIKNVVVDSLGYTGECPLCDGCDDSWDLANEIISDKCKTQGFDANDKDNKSVMNIRSDAFSDRIVKDASRYFTFPIVVFETVNDDGKTFVKGEDGSVKFKIMWYHISETQYDSVWAKALEAMEEEPTHPGGNFFLLNYCYTPKKGEPNKRDSAKNLTVSHRNIKGSEKLRTLLDKQTEEWTPEKAQEMVIANNWYSPDDLLQITDEALENTRNLLELYRSKSLISSEDSTEGIDKSNFQLEKSDDEGAVDMGETDEDFEDEGLDME